jgi:hypothetical protein
MTGSIRRIDLKLNGLRAEETAGRHNTLFWMANNRPARPVPHAALAQSPQLPSLCVNTFDVDVNVSYIPPHGPAACRAKTHRLAAFRPTT